MELKNSFCCCVLIQGLFITVHANAEVQVKCQNRTGTVGTPLYITCCVTCNKPCNSCQYLAKIETNDTTLKNCSTIIANKSFTCNHTIKTAEKKHNGTFKFWVQTNTGVDETNFMVNLGPSVTVLETTEHKFHSEKTKAEKKSSERSKIFSAITIMICSIAFAAIFLVAVRRSQCTSPLQSFFGMFKKPLI